MNFQKTSDKIIAATLLPLVPHRVSPNQVSWLRIISLPFIYYLLSTENYFWGLILFSLAALTDALDGAMARTRNQVTELGKVLDGVADKGLILLVAFIFIPQYFGWGLLIGILVLELLNFLMAYRSKIKIGSNPGANWGGKIKMIVQSLAFICLFVGILTESEMWLNTAGLMLHISLPISIIQAFLYPNNKINS